MGHSTATVVITKEEVNPPVSGLSGGFGFSGSSRYDSYSSRDYNSLESRILQSGIEKWGREEADRHDSPRAGTPKMLKPLPEELAYEAIEDVITRTRADSSPIVPLVDPRDYEKKTKSVTLTLNNDEWREYIKGNGYTLIQDKINEALPALKGMILNHRIEGAKSGSWDATEGWNVKSVVEADASGGKAKTVYLIVADGKALPNEFDSQATARAAAVKVLKDYPAVLEAEVTAKVVREDKTALVKVRRVVRSASAKFTVTYIKMKTATPRTENWMVGFDYHH